MPKSKKEIYYELVSLIDEIKPYLADMSYQNLELDLNQVDKTLLAVYLLLIRDIHIA